MAKYDKIADQYVLPESLEHPQRKYQIDPTWLKLCGDVKGLMVLDLACGNGHSSRFLAQKGAQVTGVDNSFEMIKRAKVIELQNTLGIEYFFGNAGSYLPVKQKFDLITAILFLHYSQTREELKQAVQIMAGNLKSKGKLVAVITDPEHPVQEYIPNVRSSTKWIDEPFVNGSRTLVIIYDLQGNELCSFTNHYWAKEVYEETLNQAGFTDIQWHKPKFTDEGKKVVSNWQEIDEKSLLIVITATRR